MADNKNKPRMMYNPAFPDKGLFKPHLEIDFCSIVDPPCIPYEDPIQESTEINKKESDND